MIITLKDGSQREYTEPKSIIDIAFDISEGLARAALCQENWTAVPLQLKNCCGKRQLFEYSDGKGSRRASPPCVTPVPMFWQKRMKRLRPQAKLTIGPSIENGFYYDFDTEPFTERIWTTWKKR